MAARIQPESAVLIGYAASEPEARPTGDPNDLDRQNYRMDVAQTFIRLGASGLQQIFDGSKDPTMIQISPHNEDRINPNQHAEQFLTASYCLLLKATSLWLEGLRGLEGFRELAFFQKHELRFMPSREFLLGCGIFVGTGAHQQNCLTVLKLNKLRSGSATVSNIWGAAWDLHYSRLIDFGKGNNPILQIRPPAVFVTEDNRLADVLAATRSIAVGTMPDGQDIGYDGIHEEFFEPNQWVEVSAHLAIENDRISSGKGITVNAAATKSRYHIRHLQKRITGVVDERVLKNIGPE
ncbi:hypothetical protein [Arthrobacter sp. NPDC056493]|uniref:hypothetical protein n=1 Tax=Arthrobacter sp. NPDC056493 TaxID=3345839 RepID=UPI00366AD3A4